MARIPDKMTYEQTEKTVRLLRALADDLMSTFDPTFLAAVKPEVTLSCWQCITREVVCLVGIAKGHPTLSAGPLRTSELFYIDEQLGLARTLSRWYRLVDRDHFPHGRLN